MAIICPAILAADEGQYRDQITKVAHFAHRIQIDLTDGQFVDSKTIEPEQAWWPAGVIADFHLMYKNPLSAAQEVIKHLPNLIIVHAEAEGDFNAVAEFCKRHQIK